MKGSQAKRHISTFIGGVIVETLRAKNSCEALK